MTDYGRTLDIAGNGGQCPTEAVYDFEIITVHDPEEREGYVKGSGDLDIQSRVDVRLSGYNYDEDDEDDYDWNGDTMTHFAKWASKSPIVNKDTGDVVLDPTTRLVQYKESAVYKSPRSNTYPFLLAIYPELTEDSIKQFTLDFDDMEGKKFRALVAPNAKGYPKLSNFLPAKQKKAKAPKAAPVEDADLFQSEED